MADSSTTDKVMAIAGLVFQVVIIGLLIWLVYRAYQCSTDNSTCPASIYNLIRTGTKYDKYTGMTPLSNVETITDDKVTSANTCAKWCTKTYGCNGFVWDGKSCGQLSGDTKSILLIPGGGDTYVIQEEDHPTAGFVARPAGADFSSNVAQRLGSVLTVNTKECSSKCFEQVLSNCVGFTMMTSSTCQLVSNVSNVVTTTGAQSYVWTTLGSTNYTEAKF